MCCPSYLCMSKDEIDPKGIDLETTEDNVFPIIHHKS
jgi:hypothetical protein